MECPLCVVPLYDTSLGAGPSARGLQCPTCAGHWVSQAALKAVTDTPEVHWWESHKLPDQKTQQMPLRCPSCGIPTVMKKVQSPADKKVVMDVCPSCHGIWLHHGELEALRQKNAFTALADLLRFLVKG